MSVQTLVTTVIINTHTQITSAQPQTIESHTPIAGKMGELTIGHVWAMYRPSMSKAFGTIVGLKHE